MSAKQFRGWMDREAGQGFVCLGHPCWRVKGVLITLWYPKECEARVKIYYNAGHSTVHFDILGELCRKHILRLANDPRH